MDNAERTEILERIQLGQLQIRMYLDKAKQQCNNVDQLLNQLDAMTTYRPVVECPDCGCTYRSDGTTLCPNRGLKQHKESDEPVKNDEPDSIQSYTPTYTGRKYGKHEFRQLRRNVVSVS